MEIGMLTNLQKLQAWADNRRCHNGLLKLAFTPGSDAPNISLEDAAWVALQLIEGWDTGIPATEEP